ncbi:MAG: hypothetical protein RLY58_2251, partial [Pseudomonadota bacterium]
TIERLATAQFNTDGSVKNQAAIVQPPLVDEQFIDSMGRSRTESVYVINERDSYVVVAQLCPIETAKLVDYWLANKNQAPAIPQDLPTALRLAADLAEQKAVVEQRLAIAAPKAIALDQIADTTSLFTIRQTAKMIKSKERVLVNELLRRGWVYRDKRDVLQPYAEKIEAGYVTTVITAPVKQANGEEKVFSQLRITAKGVTRLGYVAAKGGKA